MDKSRDHTLLYQPSHLSFSPFVPSYFCPLLSVPWSWPKPSLGLTLDQAGWPALWLQTGLLSPLGDLCKGEKGSTVKGYLYHSKQ